MTTMTSRSLRRLSVVLLFILVGCSIWKNAPAVLVAKCPNAFLPVVATAIHYFPFPAGATHSSSDAAVSSSINNSITIRSAPWALDPSDPCFEFMRDFHVRNDCLRSYDGSACRHHASPDTSVIAHQSADDDDDDGPSLGSTITSSSSSSSSSIISPTLPIYNWALYKGQGFGRVLDHSVMHCLVAMSINRPCMVNMMPRDAYYTFRSFIQHNTYNWQPDIMDNLYGDEILAAIGKLTKPDYGSWEKDPSLTFPHVLPMARLNETDYQTGRWRQIWDGADGPHKHQVLLSPNWGDSWHFSEFPFNYSDINHHRHRCSLEDVRTLVQNAMYAPTDLSRTLFEVRKKEMLGDSNKEYGAVHLRTYFLKERKVAVAAMIDMVKSCIDQFPQIGTWWMISDDPEIAQNATVLLKPKLRHGYTDDFNMNNEHSGSSGKKQYGHALLEPSIMDWVALHEAEIAIVYWEGAFAATGARGRGKVQQTARCGNSQMLIFAPRRRKI